jgi:hypothetical protein
VDIGGAMQKWEYRYAGKDIPDLNERGADGWEAVGIVEDLHGFSQVLMKRQIPDESVEVRRGRARYGIFLNTGPNSSGWLKDGNGYVMSSTSRTLMNAQASELDASWGAEVRMMP